MSWLTGWDYRKKITLTGQSGAGTDFQVKLLVGETSGATGENFDVEGNAVTFPTGKDISGDLRFTASDGTTLLSFWVESVSGTTPNRLATIWIKVSADLDTNKDIYCYYGGTTTNVSSITGPFIFADDFEGATLDTDKWDRRIELGTITQENGYLECGGGITTGNYGHTCLDSKSVTNMRTFIVEGSIYLSTDAISEFGLRGGADNTGYKTRADARSGQGLGVLKPPYATWSFLADGGSSGTAISNSTWLTFQTKVYDNGTTCTMVAICGAASNTATDNDYATQSGRISLQNHFGSYARYDDVRVRKYVATEPSFNSADTEEEAKTTTNSEKDLEITGELEDNSERGFVLNEGFKDNSERGFELSGIRRINNLQDLDAVRNNLSDSYILTKDLDFNDNDSYDQADVDWETKKSNWTTGTGWTPIGVWGTGFNGTFDGNNHTISNLFVDRSTTDYVGLFGVASYLGDIINIGLLSVNVTGDESVGGLVGNNSASISNSYSTGSVTGSYAVGGLVGILSDGYNVSDSYSTASVSGAEGSYQGSVGGLVGYNRGIISKSYATGNVSGEYLLGGLVGYNYGGTISNSYSTGNVTRSSGTYTTIASFAGYNDQASITKCYSMGSVHYTGATDPTNKGFVGGQDTGTGYEDADNFFDSETSGQATTTGNATAKTTSEMKDIATFSKVISIVDSYDKGDDSHALIYNGRRYGQSFTGNGVVLEKVRLRRNYKKGSPTGSAYIKIYAHSGTYGTSSVPTGVALATSEAFDVSELSTTQYGEIIVSFTGADKITLTNGTYYCLVLEYGGGDSNNLIYYEIDYTYVEHDGNYFFDTTGSWIADNSGDSLFYVYGHSQSLTESWDIIEVESHVTETWYIGYLPTYSAEQDYPRLSWEDKKTIDNSEKGIELEGTINIWRIERQTNGGEWVVLEEAIQIDPNGSFVYDDTGVESGNEYCYRVKNVPDDSDWSNTDCESFALVWSNTSCVTYSSSGTETNSEKDFEITSKLDSNSERDIVLQGEAEANSEKDLELVGKTSTSSESSFELEGQASTNSDREIELTGETETSNERDIDITGKQTDQSEKDIELIGKIETNDSKNFEITGETGENSNRDLELNAEDNINSERNIDITGNVSFSDQKDIEINTQGEVVGENDFEMMTENSEESHRNIVINGIDTEESEKDIQITGKIDEDSERGLEIHGKQSTISEKDIELNSEQDTFSTRDIEVTGEEQHSSEIEIEITGKQEDSNERGIELYGQQGDNDERNIELAGVTVPVAITQPAINITKDSARIRGKITDDGGAVCEVRFRYRKLIS